MPEAANQRIDRARRLAGEFLSRRATGEAGAEDEFLSSNADLLPELRVELRKLALIRGALNVADSPAGVRIPIDATREMTNLDASDPAVVGLPDPVPALPGYEIVEEIQRGGQGVVYRARQTATNRDVAIKALLTGAFAGPRDRMRFEREAQILANLRHPNIVAIHDSGAAAGVRYIVMDFIPGVSLDSYCAGIQRDIPRIVSLFIDVCDAVHAAHQRGVIHRDLKPGNIRVDERGEPRVLDFGLAKLQTNEVVDDSHIATMTRAGHFVGSLPWAAPEQLDGGPDAIDVRTDVYAIGVMLCQTLTGEFPYTVFDDTLTVMRNIQTTEPRSLSALRREIDTDLDTIARKCLQKDPQRRYQSIAELAEDLRRYRAGDAINARRDSRLYVLRKTLKRHRVAASVAGAFVLLTITAAITFATQAQLIADQRDAARRSASESQAVADFLANAIQSADPYEAGTDTRDVSVRDMLDTAAARVDAEFADYPEQQAALLGAIGRAYTSIGAWADAGELLDQAIAIRAELPGDQRLKTALLWRDVAEVRTRTGEFSLALEACDNGLAQLGDLAGPERDRAEGEILTSKGAVLHLMRDLDGAEAAMRQALELIRGASGEMDEVVARNLSGLGVVASWRARQVRDDDDARQELIAEADAYFADALRIRTALFGPHHPRVAITIARQAAHEQDTNPNPEPGLALYDAALEVADGALSQDVAFRALMLSNKGALLRRARRYEQASDALEAALAARRSLGAPDGPFEAGTLMNLAALAEAVASADPATADEHRRDALADYEQALAIFETDRAANATKIALAQGEIAQTLYRLEDFDAAVDASRAHVAAAIAAYGESHVEVAEALHNLAANLKAAADLEGAIAAGREAADLRRQLLGPTHSDLATTLLNLGKAYMEHGDIAEAITALRESGDIYRANADKLRDSPFRVALADLALGEALSRDRQFEAAEPLMTRAAGVLVERFGAGHKVARGARNKVADMYEAWGREADAAAWREDAE
ncbi:MAG: serine/threonine protein kinase [Phycisphaerales bacterium]|nr:serine/threonine protein kinase [Phycisphaerales bacterium]